MSAAGPTSAAEAERRAERLRGELATTLDRIADNLAPSRLASEAMSAARGHTPDWLAAYWRVARSPVGLGLIGATSASIVAGILARRRWR